MHTETAAVHCEKNAGELPLKFTITEEIHCLNEKTDFRAVFLLQFWSVFFGAACSPLGINSDKVTEVAVVGVQKWKSSFDFRLSLRQNSQQ